MMTLKFGGMGIALIVVGLVAIVSGTNYLLGEPTPTPASIQTTFHGIAETNLRGKDKRDIQKFIGTVEVFRFMLEIDPNRTWPEIKQMAMDEAGDEFKDEVEFLIAQIWTKAIRMAEAQGKTEEDPEIKRKVLDAAIKGLKSGAMEAFKSKKGPVPPLKY